MNKKWFIGIAFAVLALSSMACGCTSPPAESEAAPLSPAQKKQEVMDNAHALGETLFYYDAPQSTQFGLFYGGERIVYIKRRILRNVKLTSNECLNLEIRSRNDEGDWDLEYSLQNLAPGDYVYFFDGLWRVTKYTP